MGVYIKGISKEDLKKGRVFISYHTGDVSLLTSEFKGIHLEVQDIETPHGKLIDSDACLRDITQNRINTLREGTIFDRVDMSVFACQAVDQAPAIIEEEY